MNYDLFVVSDKPWEQIDNVDENETYSKLFKRATIICAKILVSYSELVCYFWMLLSTFMKPGAFYMVYPLLIFGYAILEE
jgi:hypothetical protein